LLASQEVLCSMGVSYWFDCLGRPTVTIIPNWEEETRDNRWYM